MVMIPKCKISGSDEIYTPDELQKIKIETPDDDLFNKLICPVCGIRLDFKQGSPKMKPHLSTWPKEKHLKNCDLFFITESRQNINTQSSNIEDSQITPAQRVQKIKYLLNKMHGNKKQPGNEDQKSKRRKNNTSGQNGGSKKGRVKGVNNPNSSNSTNSSDKVRMLPTKNRTPGGIDGSLAGETIILYGFLSKVNFKKTKKRKQLYLEINYQGETQQIFSSPIFFNASQQGLDDRISSLETVINDEKLEPEFTAFVDVQPNINTGKLECIFYTEEDIKFPNIPLGVYITACSSNKNDKVTS